MVNGGKIWYNPYVTASYIWYGKEVFGLDVIISLLVAVMAGVISHLVCKWLDGDK